MDHVLWFGTTVNLFYHAQAPEPETLSPLTVTQDDTISLVGFACRFPGSCNEAESYWNLLRNGVDAVKEIPNERFLFFRYKIHLFL